MNRYKGRLFHHGGTHLFSRATVKQAINDYQHRKQLGLTVSQIAQKYGMSRSLLYQKLHLIHMKETYGPLTKRENKYLFSRYSLELIHNGGRLFTGLRTSLIDTETILQNGEVPDVLPSEVDIILRLKRGLQYIMQDHGALSLKIFQHINAIVTPDSLEPGHFAQQSMLISGIKWQPPLPNPKRAKLLINKYKHNQDSASLTAIKIMLQFDRYQFFWNGNKRTAWLAANYYLLQHCAGMLNISRHQAHTWNHLLAHFYETGKIKRISNWVNRNCITRKI